MDVDFEKTKLDKLEKFRSMSEQVRIGGKGSARRKKKIIHKNAAADDKKLQTSLKRLNLNTIPTIEEVNMYRTDGTMIHFKNPKVQTSPQANVFAVSGQAETKSLSDFFPSMMTTLESAKARLAQNLADNSENKESKADDNEDEVPDLVEDFDEKSRLE